jgi:hypothetical protein
MKSRLPKSIVLPREAIVGQVFVVGSNDKY